MISGVPFRRLVGTFSNFDICSKEIMNSSLVSFLLQFVLIQNILSASSLEFLIYDGTRLWLRKNSTQTDINFVNNKNIESFDYWNHTILWSDSNTFAVYRTDILTEITTEVVTGEMTSGIAVDWIGRNLYWANYEHKVISVSDINGWFKTALFWKDLTYPTHLSLDPTTGYMFYFDIGKYPRLIRSSMAGEFENQIDILFQNTPGDLALDIKKQRVYWSDPVLGRIESCDYEGSNRFLLVQGLIRPTDIDVIDGRLYWLDSFQVTFRNLNEENSLNTAMPFEQIVKMKLHTNFRTSQGSDVINPCKFSSCEHLCLLSPNEPFYKCACAATHGINNDRVTCSNIELPSIIIHQKLTGIMVIKGNETWRLKTGDVTDLVFMHNNKSILYIPKAGTEVMNINIDGTTMPAPVAIVPNPSYGLLLAYDWIGRNIYFLDQYSRKISVTNVYGKSLKTFEFAPGKFVKDTFIADPIHRYLFWNGLYTIERLGLDGNNATYKIIIQHDSTRYYFRQKPFILDVYTKQIYEYYSYSLYVMDYEGKNSHIIMEGDSYDFVTVSDKFLLYVDVWSKTIFACHKISGRNCKDVKTLKDISSLLIATEEIHIEDVNRSVCEENNGGCSDLCLLSPLMPYHICICYDGSTIMNDNKTCDVNECDIIVGVCSGGKCVNTIGSYKCLCKYGYQLNQQTDTCEDVDECKLLPDICTKGTCVNFPGMYSCVCPVDEESSDVKECDDDWYDLLLYGHSSIVYVKYIPYRYVQRIITTDDVLLRGVDFDPVNQRIYFLGIRPGFMNGNIKQIGIDNIGMKTVVDNLAVTDYGLVIDKLQQRMYWVKSDVGIVSSYLNGASALVVFEMSTLPFTLHASLDESYNMWDILRIDSSNRYLYVVSEHRQFYQIHLEDKSVDKIGERFLNISVEFDSGLMYYIHKYSEVLMALDTGYKESRTFPYQKFENISSIARKGKKLMFLSRSGEIWNKDLSNGKEEHRFYFGDSQTLRITSFKTISTDSVDNGDTCLDDFYCVDLCTCLDFTSVNNTCLCSNGTLQEQNHLGILDVIFHVASTRIPYYFPRIAAETDDLTFHFTNQDHSFVVINYEQNSSLFEDDISYTVVNGSCFGLYKISAFDWIGRNTYYINRRHKCIDVVDEYNTYRTSIYWGNIESPEEIAIDSFEGFLFWTDLGSDPKIERADLDGQHLSSRIAIAGDGLETPCCLSLDSMNKRIFWIDRKLKSIYSCTYYGSDQRLILNQFVNKPVAMISFRNYLLWVDTWRLYILKNPHGAHRTVFRYNRPSVMDVKYVAVVEQVRGILDHPCRRRERQCSHICLVSRISPFFTCVCSAGYRLVNKSICINVEQEDIIVTAMPGGVFLLGNKTRFKLSEHNANNLLYDWRNQIIIYQANGDEAIVGKTLNGSEAFKLPITNADMTKSITLDWLGNNIYVLLSNGSIRAYNIYKYGHRTLDIRTRGIVLYADSNKRLLIIKEQSMVSRLTMTGTNYVQIIPLRKHFYCDSCFALDTFESMIYLVQQSGFRRYDYNGNLRQHIFNSGNFHHLVLSEYLIYFVSKSPVDWIFNKSRGNIMSCDKHSGVKCRAVFSDIDVNEIIVINSRQNQEENAFRDICGNQSVDCDHLCLLSPSVPYYTCACIDGYELLDDQQSCAKIPCVNDNDACSHICNPYIGSRGSYCSCRDNFTLSQDRKTCLNSSLEVYMFVSLSDSVKSFYIEPYAYFQADFFFEDDEIFKLGYDPKENELYLSILPNNSNITYVKAMTLDGDGLVTTAIGTTEYFTIDWIDRRMYWISDTYIMSSGLKNSTHYIVQQISNQPLENINICIDAFNGVIFWINGHIMRTRTGGYDTKIISTDNFTSNVLVIDSLYQKLYVEKTDIDSNPGVLVLNTDGTGQTYILHQQVDAFTILGKTAYYFSSQNSEEMQSKPLEEWSSIEDTIETPLTDVISSRTADKTLAVKSHKVFDMQMVILDNRKTIQVSCSEYSKCLSWTGEWICLDKTMICNGISSCYDDHDEMYCPFISKSTVTEQFMFTCYQEYQQYMATESHRTSDIDFKEYIEWNSHPFSLLVEFDDIFSSECDILIYLNYTDIHNLIPTIEVHHLHNSYRLRQILFATKKLSFNLIQELIISGENMLKNFSDKSLVPFLNLKRLRLKDTSIGVIPKKSFQFTIFLEKIELIDNKILSILHAKCFADLVNLGLLILTGSNILSLQENVFFGLENLRHLNLSSNSINEVDLQAFNPLIKLTVLDISNNDIQFRGKMFTRNLNLNVLYCDSFHFCCVSPGSTCYSYKGYIVSKCKYLISNRWMFVILWIITLVSNVLLILCIVTGIIGNMKTSTEFKILMISVFASDLMLIFHLANILAMDRRFVNEYVWYDINWRRSSLCFLIRFLFTVSTETVILISLLITVKQLLELSNFKAPLFICGFIGSISIWVYSYVIGVLVTTLQMESASPLCIPEYWKSLQNSNQLFTITFGIHVSLSVTVMLTQICMACVRYQELNGSKWKRIENQILSHIATFNTFCMLLTNLIEFLSVFGVYISKDAYIIISVVVLSLRCMFDPLFYLIISLSGN